jgi:protein phosphatase
MKHLKTEPSGRINTMFDTIGDVPLPRFGHTMTPITKTKVVLFGGATGDTGRYSITVDTYILDVMSKTWTRLVNIGGIAPTPRAAHASASVETY